MTAMTRTRTYTVHRLLALAVATAACASPTYVDTGTAVVDSSNLAAFRAAEAAHPAPPGGGGQ